MLSADGFAWQLGHHAGSLAFQISNSGFWQPVRLDEADPRRHSFKALEGRSDMQRAKECRRSVLQPLGTLRSRGNQGHTTASRLPASSRR